MHDDAVESRRIAELLLVEVGARSVLDAGGSYLEWLSRPPTGVGSVRTISSKPPEPSAAPTTTGQSRTGLLTEDALPQVDVVVCEDLFARYEPSEAERMIRNFVRSGSTYLLAKPPHMPAADHDDLAWASEAASKVLSVPEPVATGPLGMREEGGVLAIWRLAELAERYKPELPKCTFLLFVHIPKTAGTSFRLAAEKVLGRNRIAYDYARRPETHRSVLRCVYELPDLARLAQELNDSSILLLGGHVHYRKYRSLVPPEQVVTFLRHPIARVVSEYHHFCRHNGYAGSLLDFASRPRNKNLQTSMLRGAPLSQLGFLGLSEYYPESLALLKFKLGIALPVLVRNVNPDQEALSGGYLLTPEERERLEEWNREDLALYEEGARIFKNALADLSVEAAGCST